VAFLPSIPAPLSEISALALLWPELIQHLSHRAQSSVGKAWINALKPSSNAEWIARQQQRNAEMQQLIAAGSFTFHGVFDVTEMLDKARIQGAALDGTHLF
jgi:DNA mismatch repair protein MutS2